VLLIKNTFDKDAATHVSITVSSGGQTGGGVREIDLPMTFFSRSYNRKLYF